MISKQMMAFIMGGIVVAAAFSAVIIYNNSHPEDLESNASDSSSSPSSSKTSVHQYVDNSQYNLKLLSCSFCGLSKDYASGYYATTFTMDVDNDSMGYYTAFVGDIQVKLGDYYIKIVSDGKQTLTMDVNHTDPYHSGIGLLEEIKFVFTPIEKGTDYSFTTSERYSSGSGYTYTMFTFDGKIPGNETVYVVEKDGYILGSLNFYGENNKELNRSLSSYEYYLLIDGKVYYPATA